MRGKPSRILDRGVVAFGQAVWHGLYPAGIGQCLEPSLKLALARRNETAYRRPAMPSALHVRGNFIFELCGGLLHGEPHKIEERRREDGDVANGGPRQRRGENRVAQVGAETEHIRIVELPEIAGGVHLDVAADGGELARIKGDVDPVVAGPCVMPLRGLHEPVREHKRAEAKFLGRIHDEKQMNMVGHDDEIGCRVMHIDFVERQPHGLHQLTGRQQHRAPFAAHEPRKHMATPFDHKGEEEKATPGMDEGEVHEDG